MSTNNSANSSNNPSSVSIIIVVLDLIQQRFVDQLPWIITVLGLIGFVGNSFTFLQATLRKNSFCIYTLCGSLVDIINLLVNLFAKYVDPTAGHFAKFSVSLLCKLKLFAVVFLPQLSINLLIMSLIDRYACTYGPASRMSRLLQLRMVPWLITITVIISCLMSLYSPILYDIVPGFGCESTDPKTNNVLYILIHGLITPVVMLVLVYLTYRRSKRSRQRVGATTMANQSRLRNQFTVMVFAQVFVTSFFVLQWIIAYIYFQITQYGNKSGEEWAITYFALGLTNNLYYMINARSFYLSTLTSRLFRKTAMTALVKLLPRDMHRR